ncbi:GNAT family N-acetyltransferase [Solwaraspora sp. WMMD937]|uniref:GNAT family N-acetyltransferase n=1 Tax=Solwaraspora sp. WMMD937 TaxID=3016090 RepID=UPI002499E12A|nr:GNAT family N-acetyltransferase [Solwaraspora sp. WMMD937]WFE23491.1 GNAT family N-acetyltransferase [Solwaraspora sp. WMMD937]
MAVTLRTAILDDIAPVGHLHHRSRLSAYQGIVPDAALETYGADVTARWWVERWSYERDTHRLTVAEHQGLLIGFTYVGPHEDGEPATGELYAIHVDPGHQGRGVGRVLIRDALDTMRERRCRRAVLWVYAANHRARDFYEAGGWRPDGVGRNGWLGPVPTPQLRYARDLTVAAAEPAAPAAAQG